MTGSPAVIEALQEAYAAISAVEEQAHLQEHWYESTGWDRPARWFDRVETGIHEDVKHPLMKRMNALGARIRPGYAFEPAGPMDIDQIEAACSGMLARLDEVKTALIDACNVAADVDDYPTQDRIREWVRWVEHQCRKFEKRLGKIRAVGLRAFLAEMMD